MSCPKCQNRKSVKSGHHLGKQRYKCKKCGCQFTREEQRGKGKEVKALAINLYVNGLSFRAIAKIVNVSPKTVYDWVKAFGELTYEKVKPEGDIIIELDEVWHFVKSKKTNCGYGRHTVVLQGNSLTGNVEIVALKH